MHHNTPEGTESATCVAPGPLAHCQSEEARGHFLHRLDDCGAYTGRCTMGTRLLFVSIFGRC
jgi:hypothetical protein